MLYYENNTDFACYIFHIDQQIFDNFWQEIAVVFDLVDLSN